MDYQVGNIAVYKYFAGLGIGDFVGGYATVTATDPEEFGCLKVGQAFEEVFVVVYFFFCPCFVFE
jgi:hypothetical protein